MQSFLADGSPLPGDAHHLAQQRELGSPGVVPAQFTAQWRQLLQQIIMPPSVLSSLQHHKCAESCAASCCSPINPLQRHAPWPVIRSERAAAAAAYWQDHPLLAAQHEERGRRVEPAVRLTAQARRGCVGRYTGLDGTQSYRVRRSTTCHLFPPCQLLPPCRAVAAAATTHRFVGRQRRR